MGLFDDVTGGLADVSRTAVNIGKKAAGGIVREAKIDIPAAAEGANQVYNIPGVGTIKGALKGDPGDIAKVGVAAAAVIPAARVGRALGAFRAAEELPLGERAGMAARSALMRSPLYHGTTQEAAQAIRAGGFKAGDVFASPQAGVASIYARLRATQTGGRPAVVLVKKAAGAVAETQGQNYATIFNKAAEARPIATFPDTAANMARRVKATVMTAIAGQHEATLASKIATAKEEIVRLGGTPPTGPFAGATKTKLSLLQGELADMPRRAAGAAETKSKFESGRIADFARKAAQKALQGGERGELKLPGTRATDVGQLKADVYSGRNYAVASRRSNPVGVIGDWRTMNERVMESYGKSLSEMKTMAKTHAMRLPQN